MWIDGLVKFPKLSFLLGLVFTAGLASVALSFKENYGVRSWFAKDNPYLLKLNAFEKEFGVEDNMVIYVQNDEGVFNHRTLEKVRKIVEDIRTWPEVTRVEALTNYTWQYSTEDEILSEPLVPNSLETADYDQIRQRAMSEEQVKGYLVNEKAQVAGIFAFTKDFHGNSEEIKALTDRVKAYIRENSEPGLKIVLAGVIPVIDAYREASAHDLQRLGPIAIFVIFLSFLYFFRRTLMFIYPLAVVAGSVSATLGFGALCGFEFNNIMSAVPVILIAIGLADGIHILNWARLSTSSEPVRDALLSNLKPSFMTSASTSIGFLTLTISDIPPVKALGSMGAFGSLLAWVLTYLFAPFFLGFFHKFKPESFQPKTIRWSHRLFQFVQTFRVPVIVIFLLFTGACLYFSMFNRVDSDVEDYFSKDFWAYQSINFAKESMGGVTGPMVVIRTGVADGIKRPDLLKKIDHLSDAMNAHENIHRTFSIVPIVKRMNKILNGNKDSQFRIPDSQREVAENLFLYTMNLPEGQDINNLMSVDQSSLRISVLQNTTSVEDGYKLMDHIRELAKDVGIEMTLEGKFPMVKSLNDLIIGTMAKSISLSILLVSLLILVFLKDFKLTLISFLPNAIPLIVGAGFLYFTDTPIDMGSMLIFSVCFGIAVDDTIHFFVRYAQYRGEGKSKEDAIFLVIDKTGPALIYTTLILSLGFMTMIFADFLPNQNFGIFCALILSFALLTDLVLLPAILLTGSSHRPH